MEEYAFPLWSFKDAVAIREHIKDCFDKASRTTDPETRKTLLTFVVEAEALPVLKPSAKSLTDKTVYLRYV